METLSILVLHIITLNPGVGKTQFTNAYLGAMIEDDPSASALVAATGPLRSFGLSAGRLPHNKCES